MKDFTNKDCCINCKNFCFWDGDYCCTSEMMIHQFGYSNGEWFNRDIDNTMETPQTCEEYEKSENKTWYIDEYKKFKIFDKLCYQLEQHVK